jgi:uncharacterized protein
MHPLHPSVRTVWRIKLGITWGLITLGIAIYETFQLLGGGTPLLFPGARPLFVLVAAVLLVTLMPGLRYRFWRYDVRAEELVVERGIFNRIRTTVPLRRIQHLDVSQDILEREFDLGKLIVHTAGSRSSDVVVPGLEINRAETIRDELKHFILEDAL